MKFVATQSRNNMVAAGRITKVRPLWYALALSGCVALAIVVRLAFWWMQSRSGAVQPGDSQEYVQGALHLLLNGDFVTGDKWLRPPVYPAFLAATFAIVGVDVARAMFVQAIVTGLGVLAFAVLGRALFARRDVAVLSAAIAAVFIPFAAYGSVLFAEALFVVLITAALALALQRGTGRVIAGGVVFGLATLTRAVGLFFLPLAFVALLIDLRASTWWDRRTVRHVLLFVGATILTIAPWTIRNYAVYDRFIPVDTNGGVSFWYGNLYSDADRIAGEARLDTIPNLADKQRAAVAMAIDDIARDPGRFVSRVRNKVVALWQLGSRNYAAGGIVSFSPDGHSLGLTAGELPLPLSLLADAQYVLLVIGGIWGFALAPRNRRSMLLLFWVIFGTLMSGLTLGHPRLRLPLLVAFVPYAAWALIYIRSLPALARQHRRAALIAAGSTIVFLGLIWTQQYIRWTRAYVAVQQSDPRDPATYEGAYAINSANPLWLMTAGDRAAQGGNWQQAESLYGQAADQEPRSLYAHAKLIEAAQLQGDNGQAQTHLDTIRDLDRDNNDLLRWAWANGGVPASPSIQPAQPNAIGHIRGFVPLQPDASERWTMPSAELRIQPTSTCDAIVLEMRGHRADQIVDVGVGGRWTELRVSTDQTTHTVPLEAGLCRADQPLIVSIRTTGRVLNIDQQPWPVGVAIREVRVE